MIISSALMGGGGAAVATVLLEPKYLPRSNFSTNLRPKLNRAASVCRVGSITARLSTSSLESEKLLANFDGPLLLQEPIHVHPPTRGGASEEVWTESDSHRPNETFLINPAPFGTDQLGIKTSGEEGHDHRETRGFSIGALNNANPDLSSRDKLFGRKADVLLGTAEVSASNNVLSTTPNTRAEGPDPVEFVIVSAVLLFVFWIGNYLVPDLVFKNTVFKNPNAPESSDTVENTASDESKLAINKEDSQRGDFGKNGPGESGRMRKVGTGFGGGKGKSKTSKWK